MSTVKTNTDESTNTSLKTFVLNQWKTWLPKRQILSCCYQIRGILTKLELVLPPCFFGKMSGASSYQDDAEARDFIFTGMKAK